VRVQIDLLFAKLSDSVIPDDFDILDKKHLKSLDDKSVRSLNGSSLLAFPSFAHNQKASPNILFAHVL
jgi:poly(A) polymerase Pap1